MIDRDLAHGRPRTGPKPPPGFYQLPPRKCCLSRPSRARAADHPSPVANILIVTTFPALGPKVDRITNLTINSKANLRPSDKHGTHTRLNDLVCFSWHPCRRPTEIITTLRRIGPIPKLELRTSLKVVPPRTHAFSPEPCGVAHYPVQSLVLHRFFCISLVYSCPTTRVRL